MNSSFLSDSMIPLISNELFWFQNVVELYLSFGSDSSLKIKLFIVLLLLFRNMLCLLNI